MGIIRRKLCVLDVDVVRVYVASLSVRKCNGLSHGEEKKKRKEKKEWQKEKE